MFELLRTAFKLAVSNLTQNKLILCGLIVLLLMVAWSVLSLLFNNQVRMRKSCVEIIKYLRLNDINATNYAKFIGMWEVFPSSMKFQWKRYEVNKTGKPSDYLKREECVDLSVQGGIQRQNRSLMRTAIAVSTVMIAICSIALIGATSAEMKTNAVLTTTLVADMLIVPFFVYILLMVNYYVYTAIRHQQYKALTDVFYDFVDMLDDKVDIVDIFGGDGNTSRLIASVYTNETEQILIEQARKVRNKSLSSEAELEGMSSLTPLKAGVLGRNDVDDKTGENVIEISATTSNKLAENDDKYLGESMIMNEEEFVSTVNEVESLLTELDTEKDKEKKQQIEKEVNVKFKALTEYKQKAQLVKKKSKNKVE